VHAISTPSKRVKLPLARESIGTLGGLWPTHRTSGISRGGLNEQRRGLASRHVGAAQTHAVAGVPHGRALQPKVAAEVSALDRGRGSEGTERHILVELFGGKDNREDWGTVGGKLASTIALSIYHHRLSKGILKRDLFLIFPWSVNAIHYLQTRISRRPCSSRTRFIKAATSASQPASHWTAMPRPPIVVTASAVASIVESEQSGPNCRGKLRLYTRGYPLIVTFTVRSVVTPLPRVERAAT
jgi:hypothetical protein